LKTIQQRLQSRISSRRNFIRQVEADVVTTKFYFRNSVGEKRHELRQEVAAMKANVRMLADDQRLDKTLYARLIEDNRWERQWQEGWNKLHMLATVE
jgi:hypothetical protein